ncbi:MAG: hypothetical protein KDA75_17920 [Planctomycetaceae bacterium]|nr:hypothetical protein [Planctomycetaceae bacterium]
MTSALRLAIAGMLVKHISDDVDGCPSLPRDLAEAQLLFDELVDLVNVGENPVQRGVQADCRSVWPPPQRLVVHALTPKEFATCVIERRDQCRSQRPRQVG